MIKRIAISSLALLAFIIITLLLLLGLALGSSSFNNYVFAQIDQHIPTLSIKHSEGALIQGLRFERLALSFNGIDFAASDVALRLNWPCLRQKELCIANVSANALSLTLDTTAFVAPSENSASEPSAPWYPPLPIQLSRLALNKADIRVDKQALSFEDLQMALDWRANNIQLTQLHLDAWQLALASEPNPSTPVTTRSGPLYPAIALPVLDIPYNLQVERLAINNGQIKQGDSLFSLPYISLSAHSQGQRVDINQLALGLNDYALTLDGNIRFEQAWPAQMNAQLSLPNEAGLPVSRVRLALDGDSQLSNLSLHTDGSLQAKLSGELAWAKQDLPFDIALSLNAPFAVNESLELKAVSAAIKGSLEAYRANIDAQVDAQASLRLTLDAQGDTNQLSQFNLDLLANDVSVFETAENGCQNLRVNAQGRATWLPELNLTTSLNTQEIALNCLLGDAYGELPVVDLNGQLALSTQRWAVNNLLVEGQWQQQPLKLELDGEGEGIAQSRVRANVSLANNNAQIDARLENQQLQAALQANLAQLSALNYFSEGAGALSLELQGPLDDLAANWELGFGKLKTHDESVQLARLNSKGRMRLSQALLGEMALSLSDLRLGEQVLDSAQVRFNNASGNMRLSLNAAHTQASLELALAGRGDLTRWQGAIEQLRATTPLGAWQLDAPAALRYVENDLALQGCLVREIAAAQGRVCIDAQGNPQNDARLALRLDTFLLSNLAPFLPDNLALEGGASGRATLRMLANQVSEFDGQLQLSPGALVFTDDVGQAQRLAYQNIDATLEGNGNVAELALNINSRQLGDIQGGLRTSNGSERQLDAYLDVAQIKLQPLQAFLPILEKLRGEINGRVTLNGTLDTPNLGGQLVLSDGAAAGSQFPLVIDKLRNTITFSGTQAQIDGQFTSDGKTTRWTGLLAYLNKQLSGNLQLEGNGIPINVEPYASLAVSPNIKAKFENNVLNINGRLVVDRGEIRINELPASAVQVSSDVIVIEEQKQTTSPIATSIDVQLNLGERLTLNAFGLNSKLVGRLRFTQEVNESLFTNGRIELDEGIFKAYGQDLQIQKGNLVFSGLVDQPDFDVSAIRNPDITQDNVEVGVTLTGTPEQLQLSLFSNPTLSQNEQLSYLLRGKGLENSQEDENALTSILLSLGIDRAGGVLSDIGSSLGLQDFAVGTAGTGDDTQVEVSAYILPGVQVRYGMGVFAPVNELTVRYELLPRLFVEVFSGLESALDIYYEFYRD